METAAINLTGKRILLVVPERRVWLWEPFRRFFADRSMVTIGNAGDAAALRARVSVSDIVIALAGNAALKQLTAEKGKALLVAWLQNDEILSDDFKDVRWKAVDCVLFAAEHLRGPAHEMWPSLLDALPQLVVSNSADLVAAEFHARQPGKNFAFVGPLSADQGLDTLLQSFHAAVQVREDALLHLAGRFGDPSAEAVFRYHAQALGLEERLFFYDAVEDPAFFLKDMHYLFHCAPWAGCPAEVVLALASGVMPLVHSFPGARALFPGYVYGSLEELPALLRDSAYNPVACRALVQERFSAEKDLPTLETFLAEAFARQERAQTVPVMPGVAEGKGPVSDLAPASPAEARAAGDVWPEARAEYQWTFPDSAFNFSADARQQALIAEARKQNTAGKLEIAAASLLRVLRASGYAQDDLLSELLKIQQTQDDIPAMRQVLRRFAVAALEKGQLDRFLSYAYYSIYAENHFAKNPNYQHTVLDEDLNSYIRLLAASHPLRQWVAGALRPKTQWKPGEPLRVGFVLEGLDAKQAPIREYLPLAEHRDRAAFEVCFYSRWFLDGPLSRQQDHRSTVRFLEGLGCTVRTPAAEIPPLAQVDFLAKSIVQDRIDILVFQTTHFVPVYNFLSCLHAAPCQAEVEHQQSEHSHEMDLIFTPTKLSLDSTADTAPPIISHSVKSSTAAHPRAAFGIPNDAVVLVSVNRGVRYDQRLFWDEMEPLLKRHPNLYFMALGRENLGDLLPETSDVRRRVVTPGYRKDVPEFLKMADIYVDLFPSGGGSSVIEAMQCRLPVVTFSQNFAVPYDIKHETVGSSFVEDPELVIPCGGLSAWRGVMERLICDRAWREEKGKKMAELSAKYEPTRVTERFYALLTATFDKKRKASWKSVG
ncbi:MAG: glycosyltransferase [Fibrobacterota bacterium]